MGWNDHVEIIEMECDECGVEDEWEIWNDVALARYAGANKPLGLKLGHDADKTHNRCPHCGSTKGTPVDTEERDRADYMDYLLNKDD